MTRNAALRTLGLVALLLGGVACADLRANERPQATNPSWTPANQPGNRP